MRTLKFTLLIALTFVSLFSWAQKSAKEKVSYKYTRLPSEPISKSIKNFQPKIIIGYAEEEKAKQLAFEAEKKKAEEDFKKEKEEYKKKSLAKKAAEKALLGSKKPKADVVEKPTYRPVYNTDAMANTYLSLDGFEKGEENSVLYEVTLGGLQSTDPVIKSSNSKDKDGRVTYKYWFEVTYTYPMTVKLEADGEEIMNETYEEFSKEEVYKTKTYSSSSSLRKSVTPNMVMKIVDAKAVQKNLKFINKKINEVYGYTEMKRRSVVYTGKGKKHDYSDLTKAYISVEQGLVEYVKGVGMDNIKTAIATWNTALKSKDMNSSKARISADVAFGLYLNLIEYNVLVNDFAAAKKAINNILLMNPTKKQSKLLEGYKAFYEDMKERYEANNE